jgi:serine/threonine protein kinase
LFFSGILRGMSVKAPSIPAPTSGLLPLLPSAESQKPFKVGEVIGDKYVFERVIAEGGMAVVIAAMHQELGEIVAIKVLKPAMLVDRELVTRFAREAKTTVRVRSEYSVKVLDVGVDKIRGPFMVMEFLKGEDLRTVVDRDGKVAEKRVAEVAIQVCEALAAAHVLGIIHRDVKPENIFLTSDGHIDSVRVLDFGISKAALTGSVMNTDISLVKTQMLMGSPVYMSPEQMRSSSHVDGRADIWALGISMYEMLCGQPPFQSESVTNLCAMVLEKQPPPLMSVNPALDPRLCDIVMRCLRKDPGERFQNVGELAFSLLDHAPPRARMSVERIASKYAEIGVRVSAIARESVRPPSMSSPPPAATIKASEARVSSRDKTMLLATTVEKRDQKKIGYLVAAATGLLMLIGFLVFQLTRRVPRAIVSETALSSTAYVPARAEGVQAPSALTAQTVVVTETLPAMAPGYARPNLPSSSWLKGRPPAFTAPKGRPTDTTVSVPNAPPSLPAAASATHERAKVLEDSPPKAKILD